MEKIEVNAKTTRDEFNVLMKEAKEEVEMLKMSRNEKEEKTEAANKKLTASKAQLKQVLCDYDVKEQELRQTVVQMRHKIIGFKMR